MTFLWYDAVGILGVALIVLLYLALQLEKVASDTLTYSVGNALGALLVIVSLLYEFNLSAFIVESFWVLVSGIGIVRTLRKRMRTNSPGI